MTEQIKQNIENLIKETGCYKEYLNSSKIKKDAIAKRVIEANPDKEGLICVLSVTEQCQTITVRKNQVTGNLERANELRKCLHYYLYYNDRDLGLMHVRLQTWLPYGIQIYINGKEYLKKQ